jgi:hypothetical protein
MLMKTTFALPPTVNPELKIMAAIGAEPQADDNTKSDPSRHCDHWGHPCSGCRKSAALAVSPSTIFPEPKTES